MTSAGSTWEIVVHRPGGDPLRNLAEALCEADLFDAEDPESIRRTVATLRHSSQGLVAAYRESDIEPETNLLVVVDQFEELFRFGQNDAASRDESRAFASLLLEASRFPDVPIYVVVTMRSDYLGDCAQIRGLAEAVNDGEYLIPRLSRDQLRQTIEGPAKVGGGRVAKRLVLRLLNDVGDDPDQLPVLQHALMRTWDACVSGELDIDDYASIGALTDALSRHADEIYESLPESRQSIAERVFRTLTEKGADNRGIRRPTRFGHLVQITGGDASGVREVLDAYRAPGITFLMPGIRAGLEDDTVVDLSHESLMRVWRRLRGWVEEEAQSARIFLRLAETAALWRDEKAGLYRDPDLQIAQSWREKEAPNAAWAAQYAPGFDDAIAFLDASRESVDAIKRQEEEARARELEHARRLAETQARAARTFRRFAAGVAVLAVAAVIFAVQAFRLRSEAVENHRQAEVNASRASTEAARASEEARRATIAETEARRLAESAEHEQGIVWLERARSLSDEKRHFGARILAARALGFAGYGRDEQNAEFRETYRELLRDGSDEAEVARRLLERTPAQRSAWQSPQTLPNYGGFSSVDWAAGRIAGVAERENRVWVWDAESGDAVYNHAFPVASRDSHARLTADGDSLLLISGPYMRRTAIETNQTEWETQFDNFVDAIALSPDRGRLALGVEGAVKFIDVATGQETGEYVSPEPLRSLALSESALIGALMDGRVAIWRLGAGQEPTSVTPAHSDAIESLEFTADGERLVSAGRDRKLKAWSLTLAEASTAPTLAWEQDLPGAPVCVRVTRDGQLAVAGQSIELFDLSTGERTGELVGWRDPGSKSHSHRTDHAWPPDRRMGHCGSGTSRPASCSRITRERHYEVSCQRISVRMVDGSRGLRPTGELEFRISRPDGWRGKETSEPEAASRSRIPRMVRRSSRIPVARRYCSTPTPAERSGEKLSARTPLGSTGAPMVSASSGETVPTPYVGSRSMSLLAAECSADTKRPCGASVSIRTDAPWRPVTRTASCNYGTRRRVQHESASSGRNRFGPSSFTRSDTCWRRRERTAR